MHGPTHDTYHPSFVQYHYELDKLYQADGANLHNFLQQQCPGSNSETGLENE